MSTTEIKTITEVLSELRLQHLATIEFLKSEVLQIEEHLGMSTGKPKVIERNRASNVPAKKSRQYNWWKEIRRFFQARNRVATTTEIVDFLFPNAPEKEKIELRKDCSGALGRQKRKKKPTVNSVDNPGERGNTWGFAEFFNSDGTVKEEHKA